ncbi:MAG: class II glutamine amidotransferase [Bacteroidales bacterium]|nr:class II glutamine amidotransferase [Bacteroidales bacterium]
MSELIKHECGIAMLRLLKPLEYYYAKYGNAFYGLNKMYLMMEKQHNRGQDGAGLACIKIDTEPGMRYIDRKRSVANQPIHDVFQQIQSEYKRIQRQNPELLSDVNWLKTNAHFTGEVFLGHLRYGTYGKNSEENLHPFIRYNNWKTRNLVVAGNFNLTNVDELFDNLIELGQHPIETSDTITVMEKIGHFLDEEVELVFRRHKDMGLTKKEITDHIISEIDIGKILRRSAKNWDGGYAMAGMIGHGDAFVMRDPAGIRPAYYFQDDEVVVVTSERPVIQTAFNISIDRIKPITPGHALIIKENGKVWEEKILEPVQPKSCSFEKIYFSRGTDADIYQERKKLGKYLLNQVLQSVNWDLENTVFSYIPNTASVAFRGLVEELSNYCNRIKAEKIAGMGTLLTTEQTLEILKLRPRIEEVAVKDVKMRTFITQDSDRDDLVAHVYDITYGVVKRGIDTLVILDDSIVRGTTLKQSILKILDRLGPKKIVVVSSAPQIRYPDCYGIDMAKMGDFIAFQAAIALLNENKMESVINSVYIKALEEIKKPKELQVNAVRDIYEPFTPEQISAKIAQLLKPKNIVAEVEIIYQTIENLHLAVPNDKGDWYFTGHYPTPGGTRVVNQSFINYIEGKNIRAY